VFTYILIIIGIGFADVSYTIDASRGIIRISGAIDPNKILIDITKAGKHAELLAADIGGSSSGGSGGRHHHSRGHWSNPYRSNGVLTLPRLEQLQHKKRHYDTNNSCVIL
jgi:hypothetical protein